MNGRFVGVVILVICVTVLIALGINGGASALLAATAGWLMCHTVQGKGGR